ncbi:MAG: hypothetical protein K1X56_07185 [Flavobacteriales bacterium]|nr:hypothetical protein [Flavobacteriales bacterium]
MLKHLLPLFLFLSCSAREKDNHPISASNDLRGNWAVPQVEGHWKLVASTIVKDVPFIKPDLKKQNDLIAREEGPFEYYRQGDLVFEKDSLFQIDYPMEIITRSKFNIDTGYIVTQFGDYTSACPMEQRNDTLYRYVPGTYGPEYLKEAYIKTEFSDSTLSFLKKYRVNYPELAGKWYLQREYDYDYGTHYELKFPYTLPDSIEITKAQFVTALSQKNVYWIKTSGKKRDYYFWYDHPYLHVTPGSWYKGDDPWIHFRRGD